MSTRGLAEGVLRAGVGQGRALGAHGHDRRATRRWGRWRGGVTGLRWVCSRVCCVQCIQQGVARAGGGVGCSAEAGDHMHLGAHRGACGGLGRGGA